jgi:hypothetical protein
MCDYSLTNIRSRPAQVGDKLTVRNSAPEHVAFARRKIAAPRCSGSLSRTRSLCGDCEALLEG